MTLAGFWLYGLLENGNDPDQEILKIGLYAGIPGLIMGILVHCTTKVSEPPGWLMNIYAFLCFVMSVLWIKFSADCIVDLLQLFGFVTQLPASLFGLTVLAWGNSLGDVSADVAMTKKGFGEMAITGTVAGPIFNIAIGLGISLSLKFAAADDPFGSSVQVSLYKKDENGVDVFNHVGILPLTLMICQFIQLIVITVNALSNKYELRLSYQLINILLYIGVSAFLVVWSLKYAIAPPGG